MSIPFPRRKRNLREEIGGGGGVRVHLANNPAMGYRIKDYFAPPRTGALSRGSRMGSRFFAGRIFQIAEMGAKNHLGGEEDGYMGQVALRDE